MKERVDAGEWIEFQWPYLVALAGGRERIDELAYATGAFSRPRKIADPEALLRLLLMWTVGEQSLMDTAALAAEAGLVDVSDAALIKRFHKCGDWLGALLGDVLIDRNENLPGGLRVRLLDATNVTRAGSEGTDHRVHLGIDLGSNRVDSVELTTVKGGETFDRFSVRASEILVADAGYGQRAALARVDHSGAYFVVKFPLVQRAARDHRGRVVRFVRMVTNSSRSCTRRSARTVPGSGHQAVGRLPVGGYSQKRTSGASGSAEGIASADQKR